MGAGVWLVVLRFAPDAVLPPVAARVGDDPALVAFIARVRASGARLEDWPWVPAVASSSADEAPLAWLRARTGASVSLDCAEHLAQCAHEETERGEIVARYLFDAEYARAHPEALDREHLELLHGTLAAKILDDDGAMILPRESLVASLKWRPASARSTRLTRGGSRGE